jgi:hypothetical protein
MLNVRAKMHFPDAGLFATFIVTAQAVFMPSMVAFCIIYHCHNCPQAGNHDAPKTCVWHCYFKHCANVFVQVRVCL